MEDRISSIRYKNTNEGILIKVLVAIFIILTISAVGLENMGNFVFINRVLCLVLSCLICIITNIKIKNKDLGVLEYIGIGYFLISIIRFIEIQLNYSSIISQKAMALICELNVLEIIIFIIAIILYKKKSSKLMGYFVMFSTTAFIWITVDIKIYNLFNIENILVTFIVSNILLVILAIVTYLLIKKYMNYSEYKWIMKVSYLVIISNTLIIISIILGMDIYHIIWVSKFIGYCITYNNIERVILDKAYTTSLEELEAVQKINKYRNRYLVKKEKNLLDMKSQIEKSKDNYTEIINSFLQEIYIFRNNRLTYSKSNSINYNYDEYFIEEWKAITLKEILKFIVDYSFSEDEIEAGFSMNFNKDHIDGIKTIEINLIKVNDMNKILFVNDITEQIKQKKDFDRIERKIITEEIKDEFYSNISHELRTPINVIFSALQLNELLISNNELYKIEKNNNIIKQNCLRLIRTITNFIDSNKLSEGYIESNKKIYNLVSIIEDIIDGCNKYMLMKKINLIFDPEYEEVYTYCDKEAMERIILNILSNSLKNGKVGGVIYISLSIKNDSIEIKVTNDGEIIPREKLSLIFERFAKINNSLNRESEGSGLGLYLTKGLVELHDGSIEITSDENIGNTFTILMPITGLISNEVKTYMAEINELQEKIDIEFSDIYF